MEVGGCCRMVESDEDSSNWGNRRHFLRIAEGVAEIQSLPRGMQI